MKRQLLTLTVVMLAGCATIEVETVKLVDGASKVRVFRKSDPPASCVELFVFSVTTGRGCNASGLIGSFDASYNRFRNTVVQMQGNAGLIQNEILPHLIPSGSAFIEHCWLN